MQSVDKKMIEEIRKGNEEESQKTEKSQLEIFLEDPEDFLKHVEAADYGAMIDEDIRNYILKAVKKDIDGLSTKLTAFINSGECAGAADPRDVKEFLEKNL